MTDRLGILDRQGTALNESLSELNERCELARVLGEFVVLRWFSEQVPELPATENLAWITGWTSDASGDGLRASLDAAEIPNLIRIAAAPPGTETPMLLRNPAWVRPFEIFPRLMGMPAADEVDPSPLVSIVVPLIFGYMFGDVGQGFVLLLAGLALRRRLPALGILVPGGLMSMVFGWMFGSVFANEHLIKPLWLHPLDEPVTLLVVRCSSGRCSFCWGWSSMRCNGIGPARAPPGGGRAPVSCWSTWGCWQRWPIRPDCCWPRAVVSGSWSAEPTAARRWRVWVSMPES